MAQQINNAAEAIYQVALKHPDHAPLEECHLVDAESKELQKHAVPYRELLADASKFANYLTKLGIERGDRVAIISDTRAAYLTAQLGVWLAGGAVATVFSDSSAEHVRDKLKDSGARFAVVENAAQLRKIEAALDDREIAAHLRRVVVFDHVERYGRAAALTSSFDKILGRADDRHMTKFSVEPPATFRSTTPDDMALLSYTSGSTGAPKGVVITHRNLLASAEAVLESQIFKPGKSALNVLDLAHIFPQSVSFTIMSNLGKIILPDRKDLALMATMLEKAGAQVVLVVPRIVEKIREKVTAKILEKGAMARMLLRYGPRIIANKVRRLTFGENFEYAVSGGARLLPTHEAFFSRLGIRIFQGWGLSETTGPAAVNTPLAAREGTVGKAMSDKIAVKKLDDGQLGVKGDIVSPGYWNRPADTAESRTADGFFKTGDLGSVDRKGFITISARAKDLFKLSTGKGVVADTVEAHLRSSPFITQAVVYGEDHPYCVAVITPDRARVQAALAGGAQTDTVLHNPSLVEGFIRQEVERINREKLDTHERIQYVVIAQEDFTVANGLLTPKQTPVRGKVIQTYQTELEGLYKVHKRA